MSLNNLSKSNMQDRIYVIPAAELFSLEIEETLARSNTESIEEDDEEYGWDD